MTKIINAIALIFICMSAYATDLTKATIVYNRKDAPLARQMAETLADDIERVSGTRPAVSQERKGGQLIILSTAAFSKLHKDLKGEWERFAIDTQGENLLITGSDARGLAYGVFHVSEAIGVNPWYWFADVKAKPDERKLHSYEETYLSKSPSVKYRGIFINDEDWGLKTWSSRNYEKELGDIGPKTYDRVCELILRLKGNMLAPAMHPCTGAFYTHPESQAVAAKWGIIITTSHCEPLLLNTASHEEWDKAADGEWNYETNGKAILKKLDDRIKETAQYDNIYTTGMRGLHDEAMKGSEDPAEKAKVLEEVIDRQRDILKKYKKTAPERIPQIFVPYKEALDIYDAGLKVPDDITLVWPDDNYGYMKRISNQEERKRNGHSGVYYHISYCGVPHDNLWIFSTAPMLMYEELLKAYQSGADRYWLLNVGDIKPLEMETQMFMDMAYDMDSFSYDNANLYQASWLARIFGKEYNSQFQYILDNYYRLAWDRKPEFMGYEMEWDEPQYTRLYDTDFSFRTGSAQKRLVGYQDICFAYENIESSIPEDMRPALYEMLGYAVESAYQMNRKFLYAQANHETGNSSYAMQAKDAFDQLEKLRLRYNSLLDGKWNQMISEICPGYKALYQNMPELVSEPTDRFTLPEEQRHPEFGNRIDLSSISVTAPFRLLKGIGTDWVSLQMGQALDESAKGTISIDIPEEKISSDADSIRICVTAVPLWPVSSEKGNSFLVSVDSSKPVCCENSFREWSREWKLQVLENRKDFILCFPLDKSRKSHSISLTIKDPGQIIQRISF